MTVIASNLTYFVLGACVGWIFARSLAWAERRALHQETPMPKPSSRRRRRIIDVLAVTIAALVALVMALGGVPRIEAQPLWDASRQLNRYIGPIVVACLLWRLIPMALDRRRWSDARALHLLAWWSYICVSVGNATAAAVVSNGPPEWPAFLRLVLNLVAIALSVWWPHPKKYEPMEEKA
jgi:hypothetical protein